MWEARAERVRFELLEKSGAVREVAAGGSVRKAVGGDVEFAVPVPAVSTMLSFAAAMPDGARVSGGDW